MVIKKATKSHADPRDNVTYDLREMILAGEIGLGERLLETELAAHFGTSRGPVRDALQQLEKSGLVQSQNRRGTFVITLTSKDITELYSLRISFETLAISYGVERITASDIANISSALAEIEKAIEKSSREIAEADLQLHRAIVTMSNHGRLISAWEALADQTLLVMRHLSTTKNEFQSPLGEHAELLRACIDRDADRATASLTRHLSEACDFMVTQFE